VSECTLNVCGRSQNKNWWGWIKGVYTNHDAMILDELVLRVVLIGTAVAFWKRIAFYGCGMVCWTFRKLVHVTCIFIKFWLRARKPPFHAIQYSVRVMEIIYCAYFNGLSNPDFFFLQSVRQFFSQVPNDVTLGKSFWMLGVYALICMYVFVCVQNVISNFGTLSECF